MPIKEARALSYDNMLNVSLQLKTFQEKFENCNVKVISILDKDLPRIFPEDNENVITLVFPDADPERRDEYEVTSEHYCTPEQEKKIVEFIDKAHQDPRDIAVLVNCKFGMCRSGAVVDYIGQTCCLGFWNQKNKNPQIVPNYWVRHLLFKEYYSK